MKVSYARTGKGPIILLLHGWGLNKEKYQPLVEILASQFEVVSVDLPGFGQTAEPQWPYSVGDYATFVTDFLYGNRIRPEIVLGHSLGGRIAIKLAAEKRIEFKKLVLVAGAGIEHKSLRVRLMAMLAKLVPEAMKNKLGVGSKDYREAKGVMKETMKLVVGENLEGILKRIEIPTLLVWGKGDHTTPLWQGELMNREIKGSKLVVVEGNHGIAYREAKIVAGVIFGWDK